MESYIKEANENLDHIQDYFKVLVCLIKNINGSSKEDIDKNKAGLKKLAKRMDYMLNGSRCIDEMLSED